MSYPLKETPKQKKTRPVLQRSWFYFKKTPRIKKYAIDDVRNELNLASEKTELPMLSMPKNMLSLDIDTCPPGTNFSSLKNDLERACTLLFEAGSYKVQYTASKRLRVIIYADFPEGVSNWTKNRLLLVVEHLDMCLPHPIANYVDKQGSLNRLIYIPNIESLSEINKLIPRRIKWMSWDIHEKIYKQRLDFRYDDCEQVNPYRFSPHSKINGKALKGVSKKSYKTYRLFLKMIYGMPKLVEGFSLSVRKIAATVGISVMTASNYLKRAIQGGIIECVDKGYLKGYKAKKYRLKSKYAIKQAKKSKLFHEKRSKYVGKMYGQFNSFLLSTIAKFDTLACAFSFYESLGLLLVSPLKEKQRRRQITSTFKWLKRKNRSKLE